MKMKFWLFELTWVVSLVLLVGGLMLGSIMMDDPDRIIQNRNTEIEKEEKRIASQIESTSRQLLRLAEEKPPAILTEAEAIRWAEHGSNIRKWCFNLAFLGAAGVAGLIGGQILDYHKRKRNGT
jgi:hypothetical protein